MKKKYIVIILLVSLLGFSASFYTKYFKAYSPGVEKRDLVNNLHPLQLSESIALLEQLEAVTTSAGISNVEGDRTRELLQHFKIVNWTCIVGMVMFGLLFAWCVIFFRRQQVAVSNI